MPTPFDTSVLTLPAGGSRAPSVPSFFATFYSYKGGVGRTTALVNTAWILASGGARVVIVDTDLEAPGFPEFPELGAGDRPGFLELATAFAETGVCPDVRPFLAPAPELPMLHVLTAGRVDDTWTDRLHRLSWATLHPKGTRAFTDALRAGLREAVRPDYVLIDARTGFAEVAGVTTHLLADLVVLLCRQTRTSLAGTVQAAHTLRHLRPPVPILPVVALIPPGQTAAGTLGARRLEQLRELLADEDGPPDLVLIDYDSAAMVAEGLAMRDPELYRQAAPGYRALAARLGANNPADLGRALARVEAARSRGQDGVVVLREHLERYPNPRGQAALGDLLRESGRNAEALAAYDLALAAGGPAELWLRRGAVRLDLGDLDGARADLDEAARLGAHGAALLVPQALVAEKLGDRARAVVARRKLRAELGEPPRAGRPARRLVVELLDRLPPRPGFDPGWFWDRLTGSAVVEPEAQRRLLDDLLDGAVEPEELEAVERTLRAEWAAAVETSGEASAVFREGSRRGGGPEILTTASDWATEAGLGLDNYYRLTAPRPDTRSRYLGGGLPDRARAALDTAIHAAREALRREPGHADARLRLVLGLRHRALAGDPVDKALLDEGLTVSRQLVEPPEAPWQAWQVHGLVIDTLATIDGDPETVRALRRQAVRAAERAVALGGGPVGATNWSAFLLRLAAVSTGEDVERAYRQAVEIPDRVGGVMRSELLVNAGLAALKLSDLVPTDREAHLMTAKDLLDQAVEKGPEHLLARGQRADVAARLAAKSDLPPDARAALYRSALEDLQVAERLDRPDLWVLERLAMAALNLLPLTPLAEHPDLLAAAERACLAANTIRPGAGDYNLACVYARRGDFDRAMPLLNACLQRPDALRIARIARSDPDLAELLVAEPALRDRLDTMIAASAAIAASAD